MQIFDFHGIDYSYLSVLSIKHMFGSLKGQCRYLTKGSRDSLDLPKEQVYS